MDNKELIELRAALIQLAKALETERGCVLRILHIIERQTPPAESVPVSSRDSITTAAVYGTPTT